MRLASFTDYSLRVLIYLALKEEERSTVAEIAEKFQISKNHLVKVVHNLSTMGIINSFKGKGGGISLSTPPDQINIGSLIRKLEDKSFIVECMAPTDNCIISPSCKLKRVLRIAEEQFFNTLSRFTLADVITNKHGLMKNLSLK
jgi:Rrf2 family transcriptional regulator, nitric oxide-sensitive transcriptional repressor